MAQHRRSTISCEQRANLGIKDLRTEMSDMTNVGAVLMNLRLPHHLLREPTSKYLRRRSWIQGRGPLDRKVKRQLERRTLERKIGIPEMDPSFEMQTAPTVPSAARSSGPGRTATQRHSGVGDHQHHEGQLCC